MSEIKVKIPGLNIPGISIIRKGVIEWYDIKEETYYQADPYTEKIRKRKHGHSDWSEWK